MDGSSRRRDAQRQKGFVARKDDSREKCSRLYTQLLSLVVSDAGPFITLLNGA